MLVDDDESVLFVVKECLRQTVGCRVSAFPDPTKALAAFEADPNRFSLLISDYCMPGMTGEELTHRILAKRPELPVIGISGTPNKYQRPEVFAELLPKPFEMAALEAAVGRLLQTGLPTPASNPPSPRPR